MRFSPTLVALALLFPQMAQAARYEACFERSSRTYALPRELLEGIAESETGFFHNVPGSDAHGHMRVYGIMGLRDDAVLGHSLPEAAAAARLSLAHVKSSPCANIHAAAALLHRHRGNGWASALTRFWNLSPENAPETLADFASLLEKNGAYALVRGLRADVAQLGAPPPRAPGQFPGSVWHASPNFTAGAIKQLYVVMHTTEGGFNGAVEWLTSKESGVSAHYIIRKSDGFVKQLVKEENRAFHARCWNSLAIGIEQEGFLKDAATFTPALLKAGSDLARYLADKFHIPKDRLHIIGHNFGESGHIGETPLPNCNDHGDPGPHFPWVKFLELVKKPG